MSTNLPAFATKTANILNQPTYKIDFSEYNNPPGTTYNDLFNIEKKKQAVGTGVVSPDLSRIAFPETYFYPSANQTASRILYFDMPDLNQLTSQDYLRLKDLKDPQNRSIKVLDSGLYSVDQNIFRTLTIVDWSADGQKILVKETTGEMQGGIWNNSLWVYDFTNNQSKRLDELRKAVIYYWKKKHNFDIDDYRWAISPLGWDLTYPDRVVANIFGYNKEGKVFLGCWSIDTSGNRSIMLSTTNEHYPVGKYGKVLDITEIIPTSINGNKKNAK